MHKYQRRVTALLLIVLLSTMLYSGDSTAQSLDSLKNNNSVSVLSDASQNRAAPEIYTEIETPAECSAAKNCAVLKYVDADGFARSGHIARLPEMETLHSYAFLNRDGTVSVYYMDENVKYIAPDGTVREKDISLTAYKSGGYTTKENNIAVVLPQNADSGITLGYGDKTVVLRPQNNPAAKKSAAGISAAQMHNDTVTYSDYFGSGIDLRYTPLLSGIKEEIMLASYTGIDTFQFTLETDGLYIYYDHGYYLAENENASDKIRLGEIIVYDAIGKPDFGTMTVTPIRHGSQYLLTIGVNRDFLTDADTVYPVTIDPSLTISDQVTGTNAIQDVPIFAGKPAVNFGDFQYNRLGDPGGGYGIGRTVVRLYGLYTSSAYRSITSSQISSVKFYVREASGGTQQYINLYPKTSNTTWTESGLTWNNAGSHTTAVNYGASLNNGAWTAFNITALARSWKNNTYSAAAGFIMMNSNEANNKSFYSSEFPTTGNRPYVVMTYVSDITLNATSIDILQNGGTRTLTAATTPSGQSVTWSSSNTAIATVSSSGVVTGLKAGTATITATATDAAGEKHYAYCVVYVRLANGVYYFKNQYSGKYMHAENNGIAHYTNVSQYTKGTVQNSLEQLSQLWRVWYLGEGLYSIRPYHKLNLGLTVYVGQNVRLYDLGTNDTLSGVGYASSWAIERISDTAYRIRQYGRVEDVLSLESLSASNNINIRAAADSTSTSQNWILEKLDAPPAKPILYDTGNVQITTNAKRYIAPGQTKTLEELLLCAGYYSEYTITQNLYWSSGNTAVATIDWYTGTVTAVSPGTVTLTGSKYNDSVSFTLEVTEIANGTYFIKNKRTIKYVDIEDQVMSSGTQIHQWEFHGGATQRWAFTLLSDGYYTIKSANSSSADYYLGVQGDSADDGVAVVLRSGEITDGMKWKVTTTASGAYRLTPKTGQANNRVLAVGWAMPGFENNNGIDIEQRDYVNDDNYKDEWYLTETAFTFVNYFDESMADNSTLIANITAANTFVDFVYSKLFGLRFIMDGAATQYTEAIADDCTHGINMPCDNTCGTNCAANHHKNLYRISNQLYYGQREDHHIYVLWTNRSANTYCQELNGNHTTASFIAGVYDHRPVIHFLQVMGGDAKERFGCMTLTLAHETAHALGMREVYNDPGHDVVRKYVCVMERFEPHYAFDFYEDIINKRAEPFCESCLAEFRPLALNKIHYGN